MKQLYFIELTYNGSRYHGWQKQNNVISVQEVVNNALSTVLQDNIETLGAGRTDTGVHAEQYFAQFSTEKNISSKLIFKLNRFLPKDISVRNFYIVSNDSNVRFNATSRTYKYIITQVKDPLLPDMAYFYPYKLDLEMMNKAAKELMKHNNFFSFSKSRTNVKDYICKVTDARWHSEGNKLIFTITANRFLRGMVRLIVDVLVKIGSNEKNLNDLKKMFLSQKRSLARSILPPCGLYLTKITYPYKLKSVNS